MIKASEQSCIGGEEMQLRMLEELQPCFMGEKNKKADLNVKPGELL